jgi:alpha-L-rhamnosidase
VRVWSNVTIESSSIGGGGSGVMTIGPSAWSTAAPFETGPLYPADWQQAPWIARDAAPPLNPCDLFKDSPYPLLRWVPALPPAWDAAAARLYITGLGYFRVTVNGKSVGEAALQPSWTNFNATVPFVAIDISSALQPSGNNTVDIWLGAGW